MPHDHEWYLDFEDGITKGMCRGCPATLTLKEIEWLLNSQSSLEQRIEVLEEFMKQTGEFRIDLMGWLQLARRQYAEMPHNEPLCPTQSGINRTEKLLGLEITRK